MNLQPARRNRAIGPFDHHQSTRSEIICMLKKSLSLAALALALSSPASAQQRPMPQAPEAQRQGPFERADANNDGVITLEEVRAARTAAFNRLDVNKDGYLERSEMPQPPREGRGEGKMKRPGGGEMLGRADANRDGNVSKAEFDAAVAQAASRRAGQSATRRDEMFNRIDANRDGMITREEADAFRASMQGHRFAGRGPMPNDPDGEPMPPPRGPNGHQGRPNPDTNNDQKVSLAEWLARPDPLFERGDTNKDGRVTREEAATFMRQAREGGRPGRPW
jgi:hypothetical protein